MLQSDVADRMLAAPATDLYGLLSVRMSWTFEISRVRNVPGNCFLPPPRVGSTVVHLQRRAKPPAKVTDFETFEKLSRFAFTKRRKQLRSILKSFGSQVDDLPIDATRRPETLTLEEWAALSNAICAS
jgi:16S rRNA (adenine1518-N6/adenine1519-N6)-dimethyltransferase